MRHHSYKGAKALDVHYISGFNQTISQYWVHCEQYPDTIHYICGFKTNQVSFTMHYFSLTQTKSSFTAQEKNIVHTIEHPSTMSSVVVGT